MLFDALTALQDWVPIAALRNSRWIYASVNAAHIVGIALLFGAIVPLDLRLMGWRRTVPIGTMARVLLPVAIAGLALALVAGLALFSVRATKYAATGLFQLKMALLICAITNAFLLHRAVQWEAHQAAVSVIPPLRLQVAGAVSITLWLSAIACGRMLAFVD
ncbi:MAG TPA: DUF2214 domain-containing protein [Pseudolabrys sp.]|nr:DUF2214 domain-containing protein [Pseudolabrys sp.]